VLVGRADGKSQIKLEAISPTDALNELARLIRLYRISRIVPLPFFPDSVAAVIDLVLKGKRLGDSGDLAGLIFAAQEAYEYQRVGRAAAALPTVQAAFAGRDPFAMKCSEVPGLEAGGDELQFVYLVKSIGMPMIHYWER
jgi:hypothetical protein